jgi:hypothetical protein
MFLFNLNEVRLKIGRSGAALQIGIGTVYFVARTQRRNRKSPDELNQGLRSSLHTKKGHGYYD